MIRWLLFVVALFFAFSVFSQDNTEALIQKIRKDYALINADTAKYRVKKADIEGQSTDGGESTKYFDGKALRKAVLWFYGETGRSRIEYYLTDGQVFFAYAREYEYDKPYYVNGSKTARIEENRYYLNNGRLIRWLDGKGTLVDKSKWKEKEDELLDVIKEDVLK